MPLRGSTAKDRGGHLSLQQQDLEVHAAMQHSTRLQLRTRACALVYAHRSCLCVCAPVHAWCSYLRKREDCRLRAGEGGSTSPPTLALAGHPCQVGVHVDPGTPLRTEVNVSLIMGPCGIITAAKDHTHFAIADKPGCSTDTRKFGESRHLPL